MTTSAAHMKNVSGIRMPRVFISYSRMDLELTDRIAHALKAAGFDTLIDRDNIYAFEDWWRRIQVLIGRADAVVFVLSPNAVDSEVCRKEIEFAYSLNKQLAPVVARRVEDAVVPERLSNLNFIFLDDASQLEARLEQLVEALSTDIDWVRVHTEMTELALNWSAAGRPGPRGLLLRSPKLEEAEKWIASRPANAPPPTEEVQAFILESRRAATQRRRLLTASLAVGLATAVGFAAIAYYQREVAVEQEHIAREQRQEADTQRNAAFEQRREADSQRNAAIEQRREAELQRSAAVSQRDRALLIQSRFLADLANQRKGADDAGTALLLSLEGLPDQSTGAVRPYAPEAETALLAAHHDLREKALWTQADARLISANFSSNGDRVLLAYFESIRIRELRSGNEIVLPRSETPGLTYFSSLSARLSSDGNLVVTANGSEAKLWDAKTGREVGTLVGHTDAVQSVDISASGDRAVTSSSDKTTRIWDIKNRRQIRMIETGGFSNASISPDGQILAVVSGLHRSVRLFDTATGKLLRPLEGHVDGITSARFSPDSRFLVTASGDQTARVWNVQAGSVKVLRGHTHHLTHATFSRDGKEIITSSHDGTVRIWDAQTAEQRFRIGGHSDTVLTAEFGANATSIVSASWDGTVRLWDLSARMAQYIRLGHVNLRTKAQFSRDGRYVISASYDRSAQLWDHLGDGSIKWFADPINRIDSISISRDGTRVVANTKDGPRIFSFPDGKLIAALDIRSSVAAREAFSADDRRVVLAVQGLPFGAIVDVDSGTVIHALEGHTDEVISASFSPDGRRVVTASKDRTVAIWDAENGSRLIKIDHPKELWDAGFSADGKLLITAAGDGIARVWSSEDGSLISELVSEDQEVLSADFSPDGKRAVTAHASGAVRVWDIERAMSVATLVRLRQDATRAFYSPDGTRVAITGMSGIAAVWQVFSNTSELIDDSRKIISRCLTREQRKSAFLDLEPPEWCIELSKWPYHTDDWRLWLKHKRSNLDPPLPVASGWQPWRTAPPTRSADFQPAVMVLVAPVALA